ncbi:MAG: aspartate carbamoyltransferase, partial [Leptolyngbya sp. SIO1D8]|nr:aspartate carbamoyltransferase [Leptolyngbya sp. SIO1D8]
YLMIIRHAATGVPHAIAAELDRLQTGVGVLNAGDGQHEHPSQALLDLFTLCIVLNPENPGVASLQGKKVAIVGDIVHSRVARSNLWSLTACGAEVHLAGPPTLLPHGFIEAFQKSSTDPPDLSRRLFQHTALDPALAEADFVMTLRLQKERMTQHLLPSLREYHQEFGLTRDRIKICHPSLKILHPGPTNRGVEISSDLMDDSNLSLVGQQVTSGIATRMALLYLLGTRGRDTGALDG